ncbi:ATP-binding protein [Crassaminicella thermophila]|uniref:ATP-binding protein n=1 Tax=Crassaminicella thermophila TaxID=2599308 RepID=A0A5C0SFW7_CRATE|nr:ATP-binding protein [Crassaminicella thermophila]QEK13251.1 ATP-binding protein [Crassaminicella thermophila]
MNTISYSSPLYGRRTGQIKMKQISFNHYGEFFKEKSKSELIEYFSVTGGVPKYIEIFKEEENIFDSIEKNIINKQSFLYEEPIFLLEQEVGDIGTYFSIIKTIAAGNHKLGKIASVLGVNQTSLTRYLKILIDLDLVDRIVPITESNPEKSKKGLYYIKDNFIEFWFKFIYPYRSYIEIEDSEYVIKKIKDNFIDNHVSFVFEEVCKEEVWNLNKQNKLNFKVLKLGKWWDSSNEIDIVGINEDTKDILIGECKYLNTKVDANIFYKLVEKAKYINLNKDTRKEHYILFSKSGFIDQLIEVSKNRDDLILVSL